MKGSLSIEKVFVLIEEGKTPGQGKLTDIKKAVNHLQEVEICGHGTEAKIKKYKSILKDAGFTKEEVKVLYKQDWDYKKPVYYYRINLKKAG